MTKCNRLVSFYHRLNEFSGLDPRTVKTQMKKEIVHKNSINLYNKLLNIYFNECNSIKNGKNKILLKNMILVIYLMFNGYRFDSKKEDKEKSNSQPKETIMKGLNYMPPREDDKREVKEGKGFKILTPNKLLTRLP